jgi:hypothetical protein
MRVLFVLLTKAPTKEKHGNGDYQEVIQSAACLG